MKIFKAATAVALMSIAGFAQATPMSSGLIESGTTWSNSDAFQFTNNSTAGEFITKLVWDLSPINGFFDTTNANPGNSPSPLTLSPSSSVVGHSFPSNASVDGESILSISFNDFGAGESFIFGVDTDFFTAIDQVGINGDQFVGATVTTYFDNGLATTGTYTLSQLARYGSEIDIVTAVNSVPEPTSLLLVALGLVGVGASRRKAK